MTTKAFGRLVIPHDASGQLALILLVVTGLSAIGVGGPLVFDDLHSVVFNPTIRSFENFAAWFTDGQSFSSITGVHGFRPIVLVSLAMDHAVGGGAAWAFKVGNIVEHLIAVVLAHACIRRIVARAGLDESSACAAAFWGALFFGVHPLHVETINLASSRSEILATIGLFLALRGWLANPSHAWRRASWVAFGTLFALMAKMTGVLVPAVVIFVELVLPARASSDERSAAEVQGFDFRAFVRNRSHACWPILAALPVVGLWWWARANAMGVRVGPNPMMMSNPLYGAGRDLATQLEASAFFVPKAFWLWLFPTGMTIDHRVIFGLGWSAAPPIAGALFVITSLGFALWCWRRRPLVTLSICCAFAFVLPWIVVGLNMPLAEHRMYPVAFFLGLAPAAFLGRALHAPAIRPRRVATLACLSIAAFLVYHNARWSYAWRDSRTLWQTCARATPHSRFVWVNLAKLAKQEGDILAAVRASEKAHGLYGAHRSMLISLVENRLAALRAAPRSPAFVDATKRRLSDLCERAPHQWRGAMHLAEFAEIMNRGDDLALAREGVAWGLSMKPIDASDSRSKLAAARAARAGSQFLEAEVLLESALSPREGRVPRGDEIEILRELCRVRIEARAWEGAGKSLTRLRAVVGPGASFDRYVLEIEARYARAMGKRAALERTLTTMRRLGYSTSGLEPSGERPATPN